MDKKKCRDDMIWNIILVVAAILFYIFVIPSQIRIVKGAENDIFSPDTFPKLLTGIFIICGTINVINGMIQYIRSARGNKFTVKQKSMRSYSDIYITIIPILIFVISIAYVILFKHIGFIWATLLIPPVVLLLLKCRKLLFYVITYLFAALMYSLFRFVLHVPLH